MLQRMSQCMSQNTMHITLYYLVCGTIIPTKPIAHSTLDIVGSTTMISNKDESAGTTSAADPTSPPC